MRVTVRTPKIFLSLVWPPPLSLATTRGISVDFFSSRYLDVSVPGVPHVKLWIHSTLHGSSPCVFPHSEICGSMLICSSPQLIAACHVLLRLLMPRHPPCALCRLTSLQSNSRIMQVIGIFRNRIFTHFKGFSTITFFSSVALLALVIICYSVFKVRQRCYPLN